MVHWKVMESNSFYVDWIQVGRADDFEKTDVRSILK